MINEYVYHRHTSTKIGMRWRCNEGTYRNRCTGYVILSDNDAIVRMTPHLHAPSRYVLCERGLYYKAEGRKNKEVIGI